MKSKMDHTKCYNCQKPIAKIVPAQIKGLTTKEEFIPNKNYGGHKTIYQEELVNGKRKTIGIYNFCKECI